MPRDPARPPRNRIVVQTPTRRAGRKPQSQAGPRTREALVALSVIAAAALATFIALFLTSRPYDPLNSTVLPQASVPHGPGVGQPSPRPSTTASPQPKPAGEQSPGPPGEAPGASHPDDAAIQVQIERTLGADPALAKLDVSTVVEGGKVTLVGSVRSTDLKTRVEKAVNSIRGVASVDNQLVVTEATP